MKVKSESEVAQLCLTPGDRMDCGLPGSSLHGFSRQEEWSGVPSPSLQTGYRSEYRYKIIKLLEENRKYMYELEFG